MLVKNVFIFQTKHEAILCCRYPDIYLAGLAVRYIETVLASNVC